MASIHEGFRRIEERFVAWAETRPDIHAAMVLGSRARVDPPADEWADLDILVLADDPSVYLGDADWLRQIGDVVLTFLEPTAGGEGMERRVLFSGGLDVDFAVLPWSLASRADLASPTTELRNALGRGFRILIDRERLLGKVNQAALAPPVPVPPSAAEFVQAVSDYLYHVLWTAKHLRRGEIWWARGGLEGRLNRLMLTMLEWHASFCGDAPRDTWFRGRFLEQWTHPKVLAMLPDATSRYNAADLQHALGKNHELFRSLAMSVARRLGFEYPQAADAEVARLTAHVLGKRS